MSNNGMAVANDNRPNRGRILVHFYDDNVTEIPATRNWFHCIEHAMGWIQNEKHACQRNAGLYTDIYGRTIHNVAAIVMRVPINV